LKKKSIGSDRIKKIGILYKDQVVQMNSFCPLAIDEDEDCQKNLKYEKSASN
jgi:hypothetical protein